MKNEERKSPRFARCKNAILRCITRKKHRGQAVAYFAYARIALGVSDEVRRSIARFYLVPKSRSPASPSPGKM